MVVNNVIKNSSVDRCVMCGSIVPEGRQVCLKCERKVMNMKEKMSRIQRRHNVWSCLFVLSIVLTAIFTIMLGTWGTLRIVKYVTFATNCSQHIKMAADASTVDVAKSELSKAITYAEENNLTSGVVSIFLHQPKNDVGYWYNNIKNAYKELEDIPEDASQLEKTNVLMKLRETLVDSNEDGVKVTVPSGISIYPHNVFYFWFGIISMIGSFLSCIFIPICRDNKY